MRFRYYDAERLAIDSLASRLDPEELAARFALMDFTMAEGRAYRPDQAKDRERLPMAPAMLGRLMEKRVIVQDEAGAVTFIYPVSALPTRHTVRLADGRKFSAMCAVDALGSAFTFGQDTDITSACALCGEPVAVRVRNGELARVEPPEPHVLHVDLNKNQNWSGAC